QQSLSVNGAKQGFKDDRAQYEHGNVLYRGALKTDGGSFHVDFNAHGVRQDPESPRGIEPSTPLDANYNPGGSKIDEDRYHLSFGYDKNLGFGGAGAVWS